MAQTRQEEGMQITADMVRDLFGLDDEVPEEDIVKTIPNFKVIWADDEKGNRRQYFIGYDAESGKMKRIPVSSEFGDNWSTTKPTAEDEKFNPIEYRQTAQQIFKDWNTGFEETPWSGGEGNISPSERRRITEGKKIITGMNDSSAPQTKLYYTERLTNLKEMLEGKLNPHQQRRARQHLTSINAYVAEYEKLLSEGDHPIFKIDMRKTIRTDIKPEHLPDEKYKSVPGDWEIDNPTYNMLIVNPIWSSMPKYQDIAQSLAQKYPLEYLTESIDYLAGIGMPIDILLSAEYLRNSLDDAANMLLSQSK